LQREADANPSSVFDPISGSVICDASMGSNESVPKIVINRHLFFYSTAINIFVLSNHDSFRVLSDKLLTYILSEKICLYFSIGNGQPREPALCQLYRRTFVPYGTYFMGGIACT